MFALAARRCAYILGNALMPVLKLLHVPYSFKFETALFFNFLSGINNYFK